MRMRMNGMRAYVRIDTQPPRATTDSCAMCDTHRPNLPTYFGNVRMADKYAGWKCIINKKLAEQV